MGVSTRSSNFGCSKFTAFATVADDQIVHELEERGEAGRHRFAFHGLAEFRSPSLVLPATAVGAGALAAVALLYRPLLLCSLEPDLAAARSVRVRAVGLAHLAVVALAVALSAVTVEAILSTALLIGPAAIALHLARRPGTAVLLAAAIGVAATWGGIVLAYDSYAWTGGRGWPVSFCVVALIFVGYLLASWTVARTAPRGAGCSLEAA